MDVAVSYLGRSRVHQQRTSAALCWSPNLLRDEVAFEGELKEPLRLREALGALHQVVVSDLRFQPRGREAHAAWKLAQAKAEAELRQVAGDDERRAALSRLLQEGPPPTLDADYESAKARYWDARDQWLRRLAQEDPALWRKLVPLDPVVTVADDALLFECFSRDESAWACLSVSREAFRGAGQARNGVTNVDYSEALYQHFQGLRSYRETRFRIDPGGFGVQVQGQPEHREEKIDLPPSWLRGYGQLQSALTLPARTVELSPAAVYALLRHLRLRREKAGPRALRFDLTPGRPPTLALEPWGLTVVSKSAPYGGPAEEQIRVWGRRRLQVLDRLLPLADRFEVHLLGSGLPSIWIAHLGDLRFTLALSGWTTNGWSGPAALNALAGAQVDPGVLEQVTQQLVSAHAAGRVLSPDAVGSSPAARGALVELARRGQLLHDLANDRLRWRSILPWPLTQALLGEPPEEEAAGLALARAGLEPFQIADHGDRTQLSGRVDGHLVELLLDRDGRLVGATCGCSHHHRFGLKQGPCRHALALATARAIQQARFRSPGVPA